jgi:hypothetical protein
MPVYSFSCKECKNEFEAYVTKIGGDSPCSCGSESVEKVWAITQRSGTMCFPYVTTNIHPDGKPIEIKSEKHLQQLCKEYGVVHRPDAAWLEKERIGYNFRTKKQEYKEGTGMGMPGVWI